VSEGEGAGHQEASEVPRPAGALSGSPPSIALLFQIAKVSEAAQAAVRSAPSDDDFGQE
jgi:hypothetical protein